MNNSDEIMRAVRKRLATPEKRTDEEVAKSLNSRATVKEIEVAEQILDLKFVPLLKRLFVEVANGGFGPGYGLLGVAINDVSENSQSLVNLYEGQSSAEWKARFPHWPIQMVRIAYMGCDVYAVADFSSPECDVFHFDGALEGVELEAEADLYFRNCLIPYKMTLGEWLYRWAKGEDVQFPADLGFDDDEMERWQIILQRPPAKSLSSVDASTDPISMGTRTEISARIREIVPSAQFPTLVEGTIAGSEFFIEIGLGDDEELDYMALGLKGSEEGAKVVAEIMRHLDLSGFDPMTHRNFDGENVVETYRKWCASQSF